LEESQAHFKLLTENLDVLFWIFDVQQDREVYLSPALEKIWGLQPDTTLIHREILLESIVPPDREVFLAAMQQMKAGQPVSRTYRIRRPDGAIRHILGKGFPVHDATGAVPLIAGTGSDITAAVLADERIRQLNETLELQVQERTQKLADALVEIQEQRDFSRQITESMREGVVVYDAEGTIEYANPFASELIGMRREEIFGSKLQDWSQIFETPVAVQEQVALRKTGQYADYEIAIRNSAGDMRYLRVLSTARIRGGRYDGGIAVFSDLTQRRTMETNLRLASERLAQANRELARAARMKDEFLANVSHELRTPLTGILALSEALLANTYGEVPQRQQRPLAMIEESGRHLLSLINDVLDVAKAEAGKLDIAPELLSADDLCQASLRLVRDLANRKNQQVSYTLDPPGLKLFGDPRRLKQMLVNLLSNAVKFTPQGGRLGIRVRADDMQQTVTFTVWDEGIGIPPDQLQHIFEPFVQVDSEFSRAYAGTGLGLTLVLRLAELHHGTVLVESEPRRGSQFHLVLPQNTGELLEAATGMGNRIAVSSAISAAFTASMTGSPRAQTSDSAGGRNLRVSSQPPSVLLAEDNSVTRAALEEYLTQQGLRVLVAADGVEAVEQAAIYHPDLVLMDIQMPKMDGLEAMRRIRALGDVKAARVAIIALTAHAMPGDREQFLKAGANGYLSKPVRLAELRQHIAAYIPQLVE
jgi:PAS domain S-box-containing protein